MEIYNTNLSNFTTNFTYQAQNTCTIVYDELLKSANKFGHNLFFIALLSFLFILLAFVLRKFIKNEQWADALFKSCLFGCFVLSGVLVLLMAMAIFQIPPIVYNIVEYASIVIVAIFVISWIKKFVIKHP